MNVHSEAVDLGDQRNKVLPSSLQCLFLGPQMAVTSGVSLGTCLTVSLEKVCGDTGNIPQKRRPFEQLGRGVLPSFWVEAYHPLTGVDMSTTTCASCTVAMGA